jgi:uncharacterized tellurite resistance protein B-like protein
MISRLKDFFDSHFKPEDTNDGHASLKTIEFAAAVLMFEISRADSSIDEEERKVIDHALVNHFHISASEAKELLVLAEKEVDHVVSLHDFTRSINDTLSREDRVKIVELLWRVAFADAVLDKYEEYFVRKIADLLYVSHKDYIQAKHKASGNS